MSVRLSRAEQTSRTRDELLAAARAEFLASGYHGASLDRIAAAAGYTKGVVYSRFASKADLLLALLEERITQRAAQNDELAEGLSGAGGLAQLLAEWRATDREDPAWTLLVVEFRVHAARHPELNDRYAELHARTVAGVRRTLHRVLGDDDPVLAHTVLALGSGAALEHTVEPDALEPDGIRRLGTAIAAASTEG